VPLCFAPNGDWRSRALIDSGSPITIFDYGAANALGIRVNRAGAEMASIAILGSVRTIQIETVDLSLVREPDYAWTARVGFTVDPSFQMSFQGILGTEGFMDKWAVTFNKYYEYFELRTPDEAYDEE